MGLIIDSVKSPFSRSGPVYAPHFLVAAQLLEKEKKTRKSPFMEANRSKCYECYRIHLFASYKTEFIQMPKTIPFFSTSRKRVNAAIPCTIQALVDVPPARHNLRALTSVTLLFFRSFVSS